MSIHYYAGGNTKSLAKHDIRGLARHARDGQHFLHCARNLAAVIRQDFLRGANEGLGFVVEEAGRMNISRQYLWARRREIVDRWIFLEQAWRHRVDQFVGGLRGKDRCNQKFPWRAMVQRRLYVGIHLVKQPYNFFDACLALGGRSGTHDMLLLG